MAPFDDDETVSEPQPADPELGTLRMTVKIILKRDVGPNTYSGRNYRDEHEIELSIGPTADQRRIRDYVSNAVASVLRINEPHVSDPVGFAIPLSKLLEEALKADQAEQREPIAAGNGESKPD